VAAGNNTIADATAAADAATAAAAPLVNAGVANRVAAAGAAVPSIGPGALGAFGFICAILTSTLARVNAQINGLIAQFPFLAGTLNAVKAQVDAQINALLVRFGCTVSGGV
jgi:hypothetical protein